MEITGPTRTFAASAGTPYAAEAAAETYRAGGNAADAAVAAAAAVGVTEPLMSSIGGGGFALVRDPAGEAEVVDYYDVMPGKGLPASAFGADGSPQTIILKYGSGVRSIVGGRLRPYRDPCGGGSGCWSATAGSSSRRRWPRP